MTQYERDLKHVQFQLDAIEIQRKQLIEITKRLKGVKITPDILKLILNAFDISYDMGVANKKYTDELEKLKE